MRMRAILVLLLATTAMAQFRRPAPRPAAGEFHIAGTVVNEANGNPLSNTEVAIGLPQQPQPIASTVTGADGRFEFYNLARGKYWLAAEHTGFPRQSFDEHQGFSTAIVVGPDLVSDNVIFPLRPGASISGVITDDQNDPVRNAQVMLFQTGVLQGRSRTYQRQQAVSNDEGHYHFGHLPPGTYYIVVLATPWYAQYARDVQVVPANGQAGSNDSSSAAEPAQSPLDVAYPLTFYAGATDSSDATPIPVKAGDRVNADVTLTAVPALHLRVNTPDNGGASAGMSVSITQQVFDSSLPVEDQMTSGGRSGETMITGIAPGHYTLKVDSYTREGTGDDQIQTTREQRLDAEQDGDVAAAEPSAAIEVSGVVKSEVPFTSAYINFWNPANNENFGADVSEKGQFGVKDSVKAGEYEVTVHVDPSAMVAGMVASGGATVRGHMLEISGGGPVQLTVVLSRGLGTINGTVMKGDKPHAGAMVLLVPDDLEHNIPLVRRDQSDSDGTFTLPQVLPGHYTVVALENGWDIEWQNPAILKPFLKGGEAVDVKAGQKSDVKVKEQ